MGVGRNKARSKGEEEGSEEGRDDGPVVAALGGAARAGAAALRERALLQVSMPLK